MVRRRCKAALWTIRLPLAVLVALLSACATLNPVAPPPQEKFQRRVAELQGIPRWRVEGRLAFSDGRRGGTLRVYWTQSDTTSSVRLRAPMNQGDWCLLADPRGAVLRDDEGKVRRGSSPALLLRAWLGWDAPISRLPDWLRAVPRGDDVVVLNHAGLPEEIRAAQWTVRYAKYRTVGNVQLPGRVKLTRGRYKLNLILRQWTQWRSGKQAAPAACSVAGS